MGKLMPSLREKRRYVLFEIISGADEDPKTVFRDVLHNYVRLFGEIDAANAHIRYIKTVDKTRGIIRINHLSVDKLRVSFSLVKNKIVRSVNTSGILKKVI